MHRSRILLANHDKDFLDSLSRSLSSGGDPSLDVRVTASGLAGISECEGGCDALVCAIEREEELETLAHLKSSGGQYLIVVLVSPGDSDLARRAREAGADTVLHKDCDPEAMAESVRTAVELGHFRDSTRSSTAQSVAQSKELSSLISALGPRGTAAPELCPVLVIEDDDAQCILLRRALANSGFTSTQVARSVDLAISFLNGDGEFHNRERFPLPHLIFLDLHLGRKSGFDFLAWIRERSEFSRVIVIVNSSSENPDDIRRSYELGANSYVVKPCTLQGLNEMVAAVRTFWVGLNL